MIKNWIDYYRRETPRITIGGEYRNSNTCQVWSEVWSEYRNSKACLRKFHQKNFSKSELDERWEGESKTRHRKNKGKI
jgi:hypothetical protein